MQNEFEKQVQQKMEELKLVPSDPVWEKVEMQIRKKKDRRRLIFWIPLLGLIGAGLWVGTQQYQNGVSRKKANDNIHPENSGNSPASDNNRLNPNNQKVALENQSDNPINSQAITIIQQKNLDLEHKQVSFLNNQKNGNAISFPDKKEKPSQTNETIVDEHINVNDVPVKPEDKLTTTDTSIKIRSSRDTTAIKDNAEVKIPASQPVKEDSSFNKKVNEKKHATSKWKYNVVTAVASSGLGRINLYNGQKSFAYYSAPSGSTNSGGNMFYYGPSEVEKGLSFAVGATAKKQLAKRISFSTGLQYNYYSNTIRVGSQVNQNRTIMDFSVSRFYSNQSAIFNPYKNKYHFISIPLTLGWQLLRKSPLNFSTGLSLQYLAATNALRFDYNTQSYFHNVKAFNRTQIVSGFALTCSVPLMQKPLTFGPQVQYGLSRLEKGNSDHHLFSYGLTAQWQIKK